MSSKPTKDAAKKGSNFRLVGPGPNVPPGGVMVAPEAKAGGVSTEEEFSLMGAIASLSPWAVARALSWAVSGPYSRSRTPVRADAQRCGAAGRGEE